MSPARLNKTSKQKTKDQGEMQGKIMDKPTNRNSGSQGKKKKSDRVKKDQPKIDYQGLVENSISALAVLDRNGTVLYSNQRGIEVWNDPHIVGKTIFDLFPPDYVQRYQVAIQHVIDSQTAIFDKIQTVIRGNTMEFQLSMSPLKDNNGDVNKLVLSAWTQAEDILARNIENKSNERFQSLFQSSPVILGISRLSDQKFVELNKSFLEFFGWEREEVLGKTSNDLGIWVRQADRQRVFDALAEGGSIENFETTFRTRFNGERQVLLSGILIDYKKEKCLLIQSMDITDQKLMKDRLDLAVKGANAGLWEWHIPERRLEINDRWAEMFGYEKAELDPVTIETWEKLCHPDDLKNNLAQTNLHFQKKLDFYQTETRVKHKSGKWVWVLTSGKVTEWSADGKPLRMHGTHLDITNEKQAVDELRQSEVRYRNIFNGVQEAILIEGLDDRIFDANQKACEMYGYTYAEILNLKTSDLVPPEEWLRLEKFRESPITELFEAINVRSNGEQFPVKVRSALYDYAPGHEAYLVTVTDLTQQKQAEKQIQESEEKFKLIAETIQEVFWIANPDSNKGLFVSPGYERVWGRTRESLLENPNSFLDAILEEDRDHAMEMLSKQKEGITIDHEYRIRHGDGSIRTIWDRGYPVWSEDGRVERYVGVAQDITARKEAETRLVQSERDLAEAQRVAKIGNWRLDLKTGGLFWSKELYRIFEIDEVDTEQRYETFINCVHPEDKALMFEMNRMAREENKPFDVVYRIIPSSGRMKFIREIGNPILDNEGTVVGLFGIAQDITEQKLVEQELRASEEKYRTLIESQDSIVVTVNDEGKFLYANDVALSWMKAPYSSVVNKKVTDFFPEPVANMMLDDIREVMAANQGKIFERELLLKNISYWFRTSIQPLHDYEGRAVAVIVVSADITDLKTTQTKLIELNQTLEDRVRERSAELQDLYDRLNLATRSAKLGIWDWDIQKNILVWDAQMYVLYGLEEGEFGGAYEAWLHSIHPEDRDASGEAIESALRGEREYDIEFRIRWKDGSLHWIKADGLVTRDEQGQPVRMVGTNYDITERKNNEERLEFQSLLLSAVGQAVIATDSQGRVTYWNKAAETIYGWRSEETLGKNISEITVPQIAEKQAAELMQSLLAGQPWQGEFLSQRKGGAVIWIQGVNTPILDGQGNVVALIGVSQDITERKKAENQLYESDQQNRLLFEETPESIALLDNNGRIARVNHAFELLTGYTITDVIGKNPFEVGLVGGDDFVVLSKTFVEANEFQSGVRSAEYSLICKDGSIRRVDSNIFVVRQGDRENILVTTRDITTRKLAQETLKMANVELERALRMKDEFLANMSHELRTPLNAILGLSQSLRDEMVGPVTDKQNKYLRVISESGEHLLELINDILDLAKIESGEVLLEKTAVSVRDNCDASIRMIRQMSHKKYQLVELNIDPQADYVYADQRRFKQMIVNLLSNAVKFTPEYGKLGLDVRLDEERKNILFEVWDTGIGISQENLNRLFKPFVQVDSGLSRETGGTGLGLALVAQLAKLHNGKIDVVSQLNVGSRFTLSLPWSPGLSASLPKDQTQSNETEEQTEVKPIDILLVEDNEISLMAVEDYLVFHGFEVRTATNGQAALDLVKAKLPDLILMDVMMPGMDGLEATRWIRKDYADQKIPIIGLTALAMTGDRERCLNAGMDDYLSKPLQFSSLLALIKKYVSR